MQITAGQPSSGNTPGARDVASGWTDSNRNLWLFGGQGSADSDTQGYLNDLWKFDTSTSEWT
jgi:N-acetylneuraminic acid mutarotase